MQKNKSKKSTTADTVPASFLSSAQGNVILALACLLTIFPPFFYIWVWPDGYAHGFTELRILNAELKFATLLLFASPLCGLFLIFIHFRRRVLALDRPLLICLGLFLGSILISTVIAHNPTRAWVSALKWHLLPLLLTFSLAHVSWTRRRIHIFLGVALSSACISSWIALDQHYGFTEWGPGLPRTGLGALLFNKNMAAEYHAPFLPIVLGLLFFARTWVARLALLLLLVFVLLPALTLSLARGAWVGLMAGGFLTGATALILVFRNKQQLGKSLRPCVLRAAAFLLLALALPLYVYTTPSWKKKDKQGQPIDAERVSKRFESIDPGTDESRLFLWQDAIAGSFGGSHILGRGTDHYELFFHESAKLSDDPPIYHTEGGRRKLVRYVHNDYLQTLYENGLLGLLGFLGLWSFVLWRGLRSAFERALVGDPAGFALRLGLLAAAIVFLVTMLFQFPSRMPATIVTGWSVLGLLLALGREPAGRDNLPSFTLGPKVALTAGAAGLLLVPYGVGLARNIFFADLYHQQGVHAAKTGQKEKGFRFLRESIARAPWDHRSRAWECFLLLEHLKRYPEAFLAAEQTLAVHPGCLDAHRYRITLLSKHLGRRPEALAAFAELEKAAPYHPVVDKVRAKFPELR